MKKSTPIAHFDDFQNRGIPTIVTDYNWPIEEKLQGYALILYINNLGIIPHILRGIHPNTKIEAFVFEAKDRALESIEIPSDIGSTPVIVHLNRLGRVRNIMDKIDILRTRNISLLFEYTQTACVDVQIASSLGIHSGIRLYPNSKLSDDIINLYTYYFYGIMPHAPIEPFATMERYYCGDNRVSPKLAYFTNPTKYIHINNKFCLAFSKDDLTRENYFATGEDALKTLSSDIIRMEEKKNWERFFIEQHKCSFCPAFRICLGFFSSQNDDCCKIVMSELLDAIEFQKEKNNKKQKWQQ